jgi:hypothetical protein
MTGPASSAVARPGSATARFRALDWRLVVLAVATLALAVSLFRLWQATPGFIDTDTYEVLDGTGRIVVCVRDGIHPCGGGVNEFALLQYLPALALHELGATYDGAARDLIHINGVCFVLLLALAVPIARVLSTRIAGVVYASALLTSPVFWYAHAGHGEMLGTLAITVLAVALLAGWAYPIAAIATFLAVISKETALPFVALVIVAVVRARQLRGHPVIERRGRIAIAIAATAGVIANAGFNGFRYGRISNDDYLRSELHVPAGQVLKNAAALLVGPTGGLVWFWAVGLAVIVGAAVGACIRTRAPKELAGRPEVLGVACLVGLLGLFSLWYSPYGGAAWGPRLLLPWMPALIIVALASSDLPVKWARRAVAGWRAVVVCAALVILGLAQLGSMANSARFWHAYPGLYGDRREVAIIPYMADRQCPRYPAIEDGRAYYFRCLNHETWGRGIAMSRGLRALGDAPSDLVVAFVLVLGSLVVVARAPARAKAA